MIAPVDGLIILAFLVYAASSGWRSRKVASRNLEEYFLAGRTLPGWKAGISMSATQFAADTPLLVTGMIATAGIFSLWRLWIYALAFLLMGFVLGGPWRRAAVLTDAELAELRYGTRLATVLRGAKAVYFGTIFNCAVIAMVLFAATRIAEPFLTWDAWLPPALFEPLVDLVRWNGLSLTTATDPASIAVLSTNNLLSLLLVVAVTALYSTTGGLRAVVRTDLMQFGIAMLATLLFALALVDAAGGLAGLPDRLAEIYGRLRAEQILAFTPDRAHGAGWIVAGIIGIQWIAQMNADGTGYLAQRTMACRSDADARRAAVIFTVAQILVRSLLWIPIGLALLILVPAPGALFDPAAAAVREATFVGGIAQHLPAGAKGLMLAGMLAALASTLDTHLNWGASYWANDLYRRIYCRGWKGREPSGPALVTVARLSNLIIIMLSLLILTQLDSIQTAWKTTLLLGAGMGGALILRWIWWRITAAAELAAIATSTILAPLLLRTVPGEGARMLIMAVVSTVVTIVVALCDRRPPSDHLAGFYRRVRPPGFWKPVARRCGESAGLCTRRLARGLLMTGGTSLAVFFLLVGFGTWMFGSPAPHWMPWRGLWITILLAAGAALPIALRYVPPDEAPIDGRSLETPSTPI